MNVKLRQQLRKRNRQVQQRIDKKNWSGTSPMIKTTAIKYELADKQQAIAAGGIGTIMQLIKTLDLRKEINQAIPLLKLHLPYDEADHVFVVGRGLVIFRG